MRRRQMTAKRYSHIGRDRRYTVTKDEMFFIAASDRPHAPVP